LRFYQRIPCGVDESAEKDGGKHKAGQGESCEPGRAISIGAGPRLVILPAAAAKD
jgi:hypothetical protein